MDRRERAAAAKIGRALIRTVERGRAEKDRKTCPRAWPMSLNEDRVALRQKRWRGVRLVIAAGGDRVRRLGRSLGALAVAYAAAGLRRSWLRPPCWRCAPARGGSAAGAAGRRRRARERPARAVVAGLPDPVVALDRDGRVLALNERARSLAPALRQGEPVSLALRMPELIEAIGRA